MASVVGSTIGKHKIFGMQTTVVIFFIDQPSQSIDLLVSMPILCCVLLTSEHFLILLRNSLSNIDQNAVENILG